MAEGFQGYLNLGSFLVHAGCSHSDSFRCPMCCHIPMPHQLVSPTIRSESELEGDRVDQAEHRS